MKRLSFLPTIIIVLPILFLLIAPPLYSISAETDAKPITMSDTKPFFGKWAGEWTLSAGNTRKVELTVEIDANGDPVVIYQYGTAQLGTGHLPGQTRQAGSRKAVPTFIRKNGEVHLTFPSGDNNSTYVFTLVNGKLEGEDVRAVGKTTCTLKRIN